MPFLMSHVPTLYSQYFLGSSLPKGIGRRILYTTSWLPNPGVARETYLSLQLPHKVLMQILVKICQELLGPISQTLEFMPKLGFRFTLSGFMPYLRKKMLRISKTALISNSCNTKSVFSSNFLFILIFNSKL